MRLSRPIERKNKEKERRELTLKPAFPFRLFEPVPRCLSSDIVQDMSKKQKINFQRLINFENIF